MKNIAGLSILLCFSIMLYAQEQTKDLTKNETSVQFNLDEFEIIHLSSGIKGETNIKPVVQETPKPRVLSPEERQQAMQRLREIREAMRTIEQDVSNQNPELKAITDKINQLQDKRKALVDQLLEDNVEYQQLKQKVASGNVQSSDAMRMAMIERNVASQNEQIREIDQQIRELFQQRQTLLQSVLQENQEYQSQRAESQTIIQSFTGAFQRPDGSVISQPSTQQDSSGFSRPGWRRQGNSPGQGQ
jgi:predicted RNase H-like nuclease (RuvC/YqgF family)